MAALRRALDYQIGDVIGDGDISHLPGAGKPLRLDDNPHTPSDQRAAQKIMQDHNVTPDWVMAGKALEQNEAQLQASIDERAKAYVAALRAAATPGRRETARRSWSRFQARLETAINKHNRAALDYNLKVPPGIPHKLALNADALLERALRNAEDAGRTR